MIILGEGYDYVELIADAVANDLILEAGDELTAAELEGVILALAAFKCLIAEEALEVDNDFVVHLSGSVLNRNYTCILLSDDLDLLLDILVCDLLDFLGSLDALVVRDLDLRLCYADSLELYAVFLVDRCYFNVGSVNEDKLCLAYCCVDLGSEK